MDVLSAAENVVLGLKEQGRYDLKKVTEAVRKISARYHFDIDPAKKVYERCV